MNILVTGGAGYIGSHTVRLLHSLGHKVVVLDNLSYGHREAIVDEGVDLIVGDLSDKSVTRALFDAYQFEAVIHFAAYTYVGESVIEPLKYYQNNTAGPLSLLEVMQEFGCKKFIFSSTCATYGEPKALPLTEDNPQDPINPYGQSKLMLEKILADCDHAWGLKSVCLRYFNACGASKDGLIGESHTPETHLIPLVLEVAAGKRDHIKVFGNDYPTPDGTCIRDYIHVDDLAVAHSQALEYLFKEHQSIACNLGTGTGFSVQEIIKVAREITGHEIPVVVSERRAGDPPSLVADPSYAQERLGWSTEHSEIRTIITQAWAWMKNARY